MTTSDSARTNVEGQGLVVERVFDAPRELVWRTLTEPEHMKRWYGPRGFTLAVCEIDLRVGGRHLWGMRPGGGGETYWTAGVYREVVPFERFVTTDSPADERGNVVPMKNHQTGTEMALETVVTVTLEDVGGGRTKVTLRQTGWADAGMAAGASAGWNQAFDRLAEVLADG